MGLCVISKEKQGVYQNHDIQTNATWTKNPYPNYAVVPENMVEDIKATKGFCNIELNDDGTTVVLFEALEIPEIPETELEPTTEERISTLEASNAELNEVVTLLIDDIIPSIMMGSV